MKENRLIPKRRFKEFENDEAWEQRKLGDVLKYEQPTKYIVESTDYDDGFSTPVLTAGQSFILGYTNEPDGIKKADKNNPVIIFDDFTTSSHYVDFPFKVKSSAMKLLSLRGEEYNFYFIYNALRNINYIPENHERHWISKFADFMILTPEFEEQKRIGTFLKELDNLITLQQNKLKKMKDLKSAYLSEMFPKEGEKYPKRRFDGFDEPWEECKLGAIYSFKYGFFNNNPSNGGKYPVYGANGIIGGYTEFNAENSVIIGHMGEYAGSVLWGEGKHFVTYNGIITNVKDKNLDAIFGYYLLYSLDIRQFCGGSGQPFLSYDVLEKLNVSNPGREEQYKIGTFFTNLDNLITHHQNKLDKLQDLKKAYLNEMFI